MASTRLLLPVPLGPTMAVMPGWKAILVRSAKDLKPCSSSFLMIMLMITRRFRSNVSARQGGQSRYCMRIAPNLEGDMYPWYVSPIFGNNARRRL